MSATNILMLNGTSAWIGSVFATKSMLCNYEGWAVHRPKLNSLWTVKAINHWHKFALQKMEDEFLNTNVFWDDLPSFAAERFNTDSLRHINKISSVNKLLELHTLLLCDASQLLLICISRGVRSHNASEIDQWFMKLGSFSLQEKATSQTRTRLRVILSQYKNVNPPSIRQGRGDNKFHHELLLLHIGHMVKLAGKSNSPERPRKVTCTNKDYHAWSLAAGCWHEKIMNLGSKDRCLPDKDIVMDQVPTVCDQEFAMINLPMEDLFRGLCENGSPNVHDLHREIMTRTAVAIEDSIVENPNGDIEGRNVFLDLRTITEQRLDHSYQLLRGLKKQWIYMLSNRDQTSPYKPNTPSNLMDDRFIMGKESYRSIFNDRAKRKRKDSNRSGQYDRLSKMPYIPHLNL